MSSAVVKRLGTTSAEGVLSALRTWATTMRVPLLEERTKITSAPLEGVGYEWCRDRGVLPLADGTVLAIQPRFVEEAKKRLTEGKITNIRVCPTAPRLFEEMLNDLKARGRSNEPISRSEIQKLYMGLFERAIRMGVSDVHFYVDELATEVRFRQHGKLVSVASLSYTEGMQIAQVLFNVGRDEGSGHSIYNPRIRQDASMQVAFGDRQVRLRLSSLPAKQGGISLVVRILAERAASERKQSGTPKSLMDHGYTKQHARILRGALAHSHGMIIVAGPTGSGKSTTLATLVNSLPRDQKTITIEDPIEYDLPGIIQVPADTSDPARDFAELGKGTLRQDPDTLMIGEIRDEATAQICTRLATTGHRVLTTLHVSGATKIVTRLEDLGISRTVMADPDFLVALMYQRLVPVLCPHCALRFSNPDEASAIKSVMPELVKRLERARIRLDKVRFVGRGCARCHQEGVAGRTVVAEVIYMDAAGRGFIERGESAKWEEHLLRHGWKPLREHLLQKVEEGLVSPMDAEAIIPTLCATGESDGFDYEKDIELLGGVL